MAAASTALLVGCLAANAEVANQAGPALFVPQLLFAGFYIPVSNIPAWFSWMQYICSLKYAARPSASSSPTLRRPLLGTARPRVRVERGPLPCTRTQVRDEPLHPDRVWLRNHKGLGTQFAGYPSPAASSRGRDRLEQRHLPERLVKDGH